MGNLGKADTKRGDEFFHLRGGGCGSDFSLASISKGALNETWSTTHLGDSETALNLGNSTGGIH